MRTTLKLATIQELDFGRVSAAFDNAMALAMADCRDGMADERKRSVTLKCTVVPDLDRDGQGDDAPDASS